MIIHNMGTESLIFKFKKKNRIFESILPKTAYVSYNNIGGVGY